MCSRGFTFFLPCLLLLEGLEKLPLITAFLLTRLRNDKDLTELRKQRVADRVAAKDKWKALFEDNYYPPAHASQSSTAVFPRGRIGVF